MNLDQPVHQNGPHPPTELCSVKVEGAHTLLQLLRQKVYFNVVTEVNLDATSPMVTGVTSQNKAFSPKMPPGMHLDREKREGGSKRVKGDSPKEQVAPSQTSNSSMLFSNE